MAPENSAAPRVGPGAGTAVNSNGTEVYPLALDLSKIARSSNRRGAKRRSRKGKRVGRPFVALQWEVLNSKAYRALKFSAAKALPFFIGKEWPAKQADGNLVGAFEFSYTEAERLGFAHRTFSDVLNDLIAKGFIEIVEQGGLRGFCKVGTKYRLSERWRRFGLPDFQEVPRYPSEPSQPTALRARSAARGAPVRAVMDG